MINHNIQHIAIIMDGNNRWSKLHNLNSITGYTAGIKAAEKVVLHAAKLGIKYITLYAFSTENWKRDKGMINSLFALFSEYFDNHINELLDKNVKISFIGEREKFPHNLQKQMELIEQKCNAKYYTCDNVSSIITCKTPKFNVIPKINLNVAMNYGGQEEIILAAEKLIKYRKENQNKISIKEIIECNSWPPPDLLIRSGGQKRISNFMLWHIAYTELYFSDLLWPDFNEKSLDDAIIDYNSRTRTYGA